MSKNLSIDLLSAVTIFNKYAKYLPEKKRRETWEELVYRNIEMHVNKFPTMSDEIYAAYQYVLDKKVFPSMRSLQFGGKPIEIQSSRIYNCSFMHVNDWRVFGESMLLLLQGVGVGYSVQKHHVNQLPPVNTPTRHRKYLIEDSITGWAASIEMLIKAYMLGKSLPTFDYREIRPKGARLITAGGKAPGPEPLKDCHHNIIKIMNIAIAERGEGCQLTTLECHDIICYIANAVLAGGIRRSACIAIFSHDDEDMLTCKYDNWYELNEHRGRSNNSMVLKRGEISKEEFMKLWKIVEMSGSGEPALIWTNNLEYGYNPCVEASLEDCTFCNLTTVNVDDIENEQDFIDRCKAASLIGTLQSSYTDFHFLRDKWKVNCETKPLLGVSMTGVASNKLTFDMSSGALAVVEENKRVAALIGVSPSIRNTCVKPEGCQKKETLVVTNSGILSLEEIGNISGEKWQSIDVKVSTDRGYKNSTKFYINGVADTKIITTDGGISLEATNHHKYRVITSDGEYIWKQMDEIEIGDTLPYSVGDYTSENNYMFNKIHDKTITSQYNIKQPDEMTEELAWFFGIYFGDGSNHAKGIRIHGNYDIQKGFEKIIYIVKKYFDINAYVYKYNADDTDKRCAVYINSTKLLAFLGANNLLKNKSTEIEFPLAIRQSSNKIIENFIEGYKCADGCVNGNSWSICTTSKKFATQFVVVARSIGIDCMFRKMPPTESSYGINMRYFITERKGRLGNTSKVQGRFRKLWNVLDQHDLKHMSGDVVISIEDGSIDTYDLEIDDIDHTYVSNSYISHNTVSCVAGTSSGVHAWESEYYIRRMRLGKNEEVYRYLKDIVPELVPDDMMNPKQAVLELPIKAPDGAITKSESPIDLLERVKRLKNEWINPGHISGDNTHNTSCTVSLNSDEWESVGEWMWENKEHYNGLSVFPMSNHTYSQLPFEACSKEEYDRRIALVKSIDLTQVIEEDNNTAFVAESSCAGGNCEIK